jgi:hypothetical protein
MRLIAALLLASLLVGSSLHAADDPPKPPEGWKDYTAKDKSFTVWLPDDKAKPEEKLKVEVLKKGVSLRITTVAIEQKDGPRFEAGAVLVMPYGGDFAKLKSATRVQILRDFIVADSKGKLGDDTEVKQRRVPGREFFVQTENTIYRHRVFAFADRFFVVSVIGTKEQVKSKEADTFLDSYKIPESYTGPAEKDKKDK